MENLTALTCPNCGATTTNHKNCEYCGSVLVRFADKGIEIDQSRYGTNAWIFPGLIEILKLYYAKMNVYSETFLNINDGFNGQQLIEINSYIDGGDSQRGIYVIYNECREENFPIIERIKKTDFFPLFHNNPDKSIGGIYINYGSDIEGAARIITQLLIQVHGMDQNTTILEYEMLIFPEGNTDDIEEYYRGGKTEPFHRIAQLTV